MQREPVPSGLVGGQRLAAPLPIHPGVSCDLHGLVVDREDTRRLEIRLAEIIRRLSALRFPAVAGVALQHQRPVGVETQRIAEIGARCLKIERRDRGVRHSVEPAHFPGIDPGAKRFCIDAGLADAAACKCFADAMGVGARHGGVAHPDLLVGPAFLLRARRHRLPEQRPLRAIGCAARIHEVGGDVPPLDAILRMRAVIGGKRQHPAGHDGLRNPPPRCRVLQSPARAMLCGRAPARQARRRSRGAKVASQRSSAKIFARAAGCIRASLRTGSSAASKAASIATANSSIKCSGKT